MEQLIAETREDLGTPIKVGMFGPKYVGISIGRCLTDDETDRLGARAVQTAITVAVWMPGPRGLLLRPRKKA